MNMPRNFCRRLQAALLLGVLTPFAWMSWSVAHAQQQSQTPQASPTPASTPPPDRQPGTPTGQMRFDALSPSPTSSDPVRALQYRSIGPFRGGRVTAEEYGLNKTKRRRNFIASRLIMIFHITSMERSKTTRQRGRRADRASPRGL